MKSYRSWTRHFQAFTKSKDYKLLTQQDVFDFFEPSRRQSKMRLGSSGRITPIRSLQI
ncbi:MAG: hypothetical protein ACU84H_17135 [Gammaproteobacteria bacterium]